MKHIYKTLLLLVFTSLALTLAGCNTIPQTREVVKTKTVVLDVPEVFLKKTPVPEAYTKEQYLAATWPERAQLNAELAAKLYQSVSQANTDKVQLQAWILKEKQRIKAANDSERPNP